MWYNYCYKETLSYAATIVAKKLSHSRVDSIFCYGLVLLETNHNRGQLELLCIVSHNMLGPEPTAQQHFLFPCVSFYGLCLYKLPLRWTPT